MLPPSPPGPPALRLSLLQEDPLIVEPEEFVARPVGCLDRNACPGPECEYLIDHIGRRRLLLVLQFQMKVQEQTEGLSSCWESASG